jgi:ankyrin repeat protein
MISTKKSNPHNYWNYAFIGPLLFAVLLIINKPFPAIAHTGSDGFRQVSKGPENSTLDIFLRDLSTDFHYKDEIHTNDGMNSGTECQALLKAIKEKNLSKVKELLKHTDPNCVYESPEKKGINIKEGQKFFVQDPRSPLVAAARDGDTEIGQLLIEADADVEFHAQGDETPLMAASANGNLDFVKLLMANGADLNRKLSGDGTALIVASRQGHVETVKYLISQGAEVDGMVDTDGTPLINSVRMGHYEVSKILLENGADPYLSTPGDEYPLYHAIKSKNKSMIELLEKYKKGN